MKKYILYITIIAFISALALGVQAATVMIDPATQLSPSKGGTLTIDAKVADATDLFGYELKLSFDKTALKFSKIAEGSFLGTGGITTIAFLTLDGKMVYFAAPDSLGIPPADKEFTPDIIAGINAAGVLKVAGTRLAAAKGADGAGALFKVTFEVLEAKASAFGLQDVKLANSNGQITAADLKNGIVEVPTCVKGDVNKDGKVSSPDAILTLRISAGLITPDAYQKCAADVIEDGAINAKDAIRILRTAAGLPAPGIDTIAKANSQITITLADAHGVAGESITVPVQVDNTYSLAGGDVSIHYDQRVLRAVEVSSDPDVLLASNVSEPGMVLISFASADSLKGKNVAKIRFDILTDDISPLTLEKVDLYSPDAIQLISKAIDKEFRSYAMPPERSDLLQNFPNPFNPETWIPYQLKDASEVIIRIYNAAGEMVRQLDLGHKPAGLYVSQGRAAYWDGKNNFGTPVASGVYFYSIKAGDFVAVKKLVVLK